MKKLIFSLVVWLIPFLILSQEMNDNFTERLSQEIYEKARNAYSQVPEFLKWQSENGYVKQRSLNANHVLFSWPMRVNSNYDDIPNYYMIQNYVDQTWGNGSSDDWRCSGRTYEGHEGLDINLFPFWWRMKDNDNVFAAAAAPGIVISVEDGINNDDNCANDGMGANHIAILHADSTITRYLHIKTGSALVQVDQYVEEGKLLCHIASSGRSSNPHLHFDVRNKNNDWIEPFFSTNPSLECNIRNTDSWWQNQKKFYEPQINRVMTHNSIPALQGYVNIGYNNSFCKNHENATTQNQFSAGQKVYVGAAIHDALNTDSLKITVTDPLGNVYITINKSVSTDLVGRIPRMYRVESFDLPVNAVTGTHTITLNYKYASWQDNGGPSFISTKTYVHYFTVGCTTNKVLISTVSGRAGHIVSNSISSTQTLNVGANTIYQSGNYIDLKPGFTATAGTTFKAKIRGCDYCD